jgi:hypothetical protein
LTHVASSATTTASLVSGSRPSISASLPALRQGVSGRVFRALLGGVWITIAAYTLASGWAYYQLPLDQRAYSPLHQRFAPSGTMGLIFGIAGTACMVVGVGVYAARKRVPILRSMGSLSRWLEFHIFLCTLGPYLILLHTSFKFGGLVAVAFWSMTVVVVSGLFGRYVYSYLPKTIGGRVRSLESVKKQKSVLIQAIAMDAGLEPKEVKHALLLPTVREAPGIPTALWLAFRYDITARWRRRQIRRFLASRQLPKHVREWATSLLTEQVALEQQIVLLSPFRRLFRYWHLLHLPLSVVMLVIVAVHVTVAVLFGYAWPT